MDLAQLELNGELAMGQVVLDHDQQAGRVAVETMDDSRPIRTGQGREGVVVELEGVDQCPAPVSLGRVGDHAGGLVDDGQKLVLVHDLDGDVFRLRGRVGQLGEPDAIPCRLAGRGTTP